MQSNGVKHRADIFTANGAIIELQYNSLAPAEIREREQFYNNMMWIVKADDFHKNFDLRRRDGYYSFRWKHPRKSWWVATKPIILDLHSQLFLIKKVYDEVPCGGWGIGVEFKKLMEVTQNPYSEVEYAAYKAKRDLEYKIYAGILDAYGNPITHHCDDY